MLLQVIFLLKVSWSDPPLPDEGLSFQCVRSVACWCWVKMCLQVDFEVLKVCTCWAWAVQQCSCCSWQSLSYYNTWTQLPLCKQTVAASHCALMVSVTLAAPEHHGSKLCADRHLRCNNHNWLLVVLVRVRDQKITSNPFCTLNFHASLRQTFGCVTWVKKLAYSKLQTQAEKFGSFPRLTCRSWLQKVNARLPH